MTHHARLAVGLVVAALMLLPANGCQPGKRRSRKRPRLTPETPLVIRVDGNSRVQLGGQWYELFGEQRQVREFLRQESQRYRKMYERYGIELPKGRIGRKVTDYLPTQVIIHVEPGTKGGTIGNIRRNLKEFGFVKVTMKWPDESPRSSRSGSTP